MPARGLSDHSIAVLTAMEQLGREASGAEPLRLGTIERAAIVAQRHAVLFARFLQRDKAAEHVALHALGLAVVGMAVTAAAGRLDPDHVAALDRRAVVDR